MEATMARHNVTVEMFTRDLWEAMRSDAREQLGDAVTDEMFNRHIVPWGELPPAQREAKITLAREELLKILDRAGYLVVKKRSP